MPSEIFLIVASPRPDLRYHDSATQTFEARIGSDGNPHNSDRLCATIQEARIVVDYFNKLNKYWTYRLHEDRHQKTFMYSE